MDLQQMMDTLMALPPGPRRDWWLGAAAWLAIVFLYFALEALWTRRRAGLAGWAVMRIMGLVAIGLTFAAVWLPARAVSGFAGLAVFYGLLFTVAPLLWFGLRCRGLKIALVWEGGLFNAPAAWLLVCAWFCRRDHNTR